ncbi:MAG: NAD(P)/FAD-dependent oxidoreductase [Prevotella sp.]|nr:NAD(P)/FAD-dependent oxidoreductase [Prevotella sp.]
MMNQEYQHTEVVIIGAGPAGAMCANQLRKAGIDCVLVDFATFPREKVCGGGLTPKAYRLLGELMPDFTYEYRSVQRVSLQMGVEYLGEITPTHELRIVNRKDFDDALLQRYLQQGGVFIQDSFSRFEEQADGQLLVMLRSGRLLVCKYLIAADGANSRVRKQLLGDYHGNVLFMEQYVEPQQDAIMGSVSNDFPKGYFYRFPSIGHDVVGFGDKLTNPARFRKMLQQFGIEETTIKGANIPVEVVQSDRDNIMLVGDAGGFANSLSYEGIYYALATGYHASQAVIEHKPFSETNRDIFRRKRRERLLTSLFYSRLGMIIVRTCFALSNRLVRRIFDSGLG